MKLFHVQEVQLDMSRLFILSCCSPLVAAIFRRRNRGCHFCSESSTGSKLSGWLLRFFFSKCISTKYWYYWWFRNPANQLRLVDYPFIYPRWWSPDFWTINSKWNWQQKMMLKWCWTTILAIWGSTFREAPELIPSAVSLCVEPLESNRVEVLWSTLWGTNISPPKVYLKMIFLFPFGGICWYASIIHIDGYQKVSRKPRR